MAVGKMDRPTGPSGILSSNRPMKKAGGKVSMGSRKGVQCPTGSKYVGAKK